ncbi:DUF342 domain-containing protein, partial [bacterium]|nr:DUF342 domain-containing protein [bacterium]
MTKVSVTVNQEQSEAKISLSQDSDDFEDVTVDQLVTALKKNGVTTGISKKNLFAIRDKFNANPTQLVTATIAKGVPKKPVSQHHYQFHFTTGKNIGKLKGSDQIDYKNKGVIKFLQPGDNLLTITLGQEGTPGRLVDGTIIQNTPLTPLRKYKAGSGVIREEETNKVIYKATTAGHPSLNGDTLEVSNTFHINGDVDLDTGHIKFAGPIEVSGNLLASFQIISNADITIDKTISGSVKTKAGLTAHGGIIGSENEEITVGGELTCEYISAAKNIQTGGKITVTKHIINSTISTTQTVSCQEMITGDS